MSTEPAGTEGIFKPRRFYNLVLKPKDWCGYFKGVCNIDNNIGEQYCWACKYRIPLDIPDLLAERGTKIEKEIDK